MSLYKPLHLLALIQTCIISFTPQKSPLRAFTLILQMRELRVEELSNV